MYGSSCDRLFYEELLFRHYLQYCSGTTRPTDIQLCLWVHLQVRCDKIPSIAVNMSSSSSINCTSRIVNMRLEFNLFRHVYV